VPHESELPALSCKANLTPRPILTNCSGARGLRPPGALARTRWTERRSHSRRNEAYPPTNSRRVARGLGGYAHRARSRAPGGPKRVGLPRRNEAHPPTNSRRVARGLGGYCRGDDPQTLGPAQQDYTAQRRPWRPTTGCHSPTKPTKVGPGPTYRASTQNTHDRPKQGRPLDASPRMRPPGGRTTPDLRRSGPDLGVPPLVKGGLDNRGKVHPGGDSGHAALTISTL
jgi:hypothetical protein